DDLASSSTAMAWGTVSALLGRPALPFGVVISSATFRVTLSRACACQIEPYRMAWNLCRVRVDSFSVRPSSQSSTSSARSSLSFALPMRGMTCLSALLSRYGAGPAVPLLLDRAVVLTDEDLRHWVLRLESACEAPGGPA